jgi:rhamnose transport system permease protein
VATSREAGVLLALALLLGAAAVFGPQLLLGPDSMRDLLLTPAILVILAVGQTLVLATRNIDLSVGSVLGLTAWLTGQLFVAFPTMPVVGVFLAAMAMGAVLGLVNGVLVTAAKAPALVITLGTLYAYRGINVMWADSRMVNASDMPREFLAFGIGSFAGVPHLTIIALVVLVVLGWYLRSRPRGRELYAIGSDPDAARL